MSNSTTAGSSPKMHALLIGVDCYLPNELPDGGWYPSLSGCVPDIKRVEKFLTSKLKMPAGQIAKLTATNSGGEQPPEPKAKWPTYANMVQAFKDLTDRAQAGDQVYIHYSGHGGRAKTSFPALKGKDALDEGLVPTDIGTAQYLLDLEMAYILQRMVNKGLIVTVVLDSCHSGGATKGVGRARRRGIAAIDQPRTAASQVASGEQLAAAWNAATHGKPRAIKPGAGWLPEPVGYVLLAACRPHESAMEYELTPGKWGGALTYWLLDSLKQIGPGLSYEMVHNRVLAKVHTLFPEQTPQLQGEGARVLFGSDKVEPLLSVNVLEVDAAQKRLRLATGQAQDVTKGAVFAVYPPATTDLSRIDQRQALAQVDELSALESWCKITQQFGTKAIKVGAQAVLIDPGSFKLVRTVALFSQEGLPAGVDQVAALENVRAALKAGSKWVALAGEGKPVDFQVTVNTAGEYEIWGKAGTPLPNLRPPIKITDPGAAQGIVQRLVHLAKYDSIRVFDNYDGASPLARGLEVKLMRPQAGWEPGNLPVLEPLADAGSTPVVKVGERLFLCIKNRTTQVLNVTVLNLQSDWGVSQPYPVNQAFEALDPGAEVKYPLVASLPAGSTTGTEVLKVFGCIGPSSYQWLTMSPLDQPPAAKGMLKSAANPFEALMAAFADDSPKTKSMTAVVAPSYDWTMAQIDVQIQQSQ